MEAGRQQETTEVIQVRENSGLDRQWHGYGKKWSDSGYILRVQLKALTDNLHMGYERKNNQE